MCYAQVNKFYLKVSCKLVLCARCAIDFMVGGWLSCRSSGQWSCRYHRAWYEAWTTYTLRIHPWFTETSRFRMSSLETTTRPRSLLCVWCLDYSDIFCIWNECCTVFVTVTQALLCCGEQISGRNRVIFNSKKLIYFNPTETVCDLNVWKCWSSVWQLSGKLCQVTVLAKMTPLDSSWWGTSNGMKVLSLPAKDIRWLVGALSLVKGTI